jgi:hypothetical protein
MGAKFGRRFGSLNFRLLRLPTQALQRLAHWLEAILHRLCR